MKKLLYIILLLPLLVNAQTNGTIQKTSATGTIRGSFGSLGLDTLVNVNAPTNGYVPVYNSTLKKSVWTNPSTFSPTISFGTFGSTPNAQGGSYSGGVITLQPASLTHPGGVTTGEQYFSGQKRFYASGSGHISLNSTSTPRLSLINSLYDLNIGNNGDEINFKYNNYDFILKPASHPVSNLTLNLPASSGTLLLDNGSGSGLSGVVLTSGNQSIAGSKTFSDQIVATSGIQTGSTTAFASSYSGTSSNDITLQNAGGQMIVGIDNSTGSVTGGVYNRFISLPTTRNFVIGNAGTNPLTLNGNTGALTIIGSISSTPQGTLYGTATGSITSSQLATSLTDETGTGSSVFSTSPTLVTPNIGAATASTINASGQVTIGSATGTIRLGTNGSDYGTLSYSGGATSLRTDWASTSAQLNLYANSVGFQVSGTGNATLTGTLTQGVSDKRFKKNIKIIPNALQKINSINGYTYEYDLENPDLTYIPKEGVDIGVIAQEIETAIPQAVSIAPIDRNKEGKSKSGKNYLTVNYEKIIPLLIQGIKEQQTIIKKQDARILELEKLYLELKK